MEAKQLLVTSLVPASPPKVWEFYNDPKHVVNWNAAHESWSCPKAKNDLREGGKFSYRMEAKDGSFGFDFSGTYHTVRQSEELAYTLDDGRKVNVKFYPHEGENTQVEVLFEPEQLNDIEMQQQGWQAILDNFRHYVASTKLNIKT